MNEQRLNVTVGKHIFHVSFFREYHLKYEELVIPGRNVSDILEIVFKNYDKRIRPFYGGKCIT